MKIGGLQKTTLIDYPGKIAATVFLSGCNFLCPWCYSPELVLPEKIKKQPEISKKEFFGFLKEKKGLLEGIVVCGGEPTINRELPDFIKKIKDLGFSVKLDTNGLNPKMLKNLIAQKLIDYIAMDVKAPLKAELKFQIPNYKSQINLKLQIQKSVKIIKNSGVDYEFRTTVVPGTHSKEDIIQMAKDIAPADKYFLQNFRPEKTIDPAFKKIKPYPDEFLEEIIKEISPLFKICKIR